MKKKVEFLSSEGDQEKIMYFLYQYCYWFLALEIQLDRFFVCEFPRRGEASFCQEFPRVTVSSLLCKLILRCLNF